MVDYLVDHPANTFIMVVLFAAIGIAVVNESPLPLGASSAGVRRDCNRRVLFNNALQPR
jgi:hypothetical protein